MKKILMGLCLGALLTVGSVEAATEEYTLHPGAQLQIHVLGHGDISSPTDNSDSSYVVRPDGNMDFPLVGTINTTGKTVTEFKQELTEKLSVYIKEPKISINVTKFGSTRVFVLGRIRHQGTFNLTRGHRVLDALSAAGGFTNKTAKKRVFLIRKGDEQNIQELNFNNFLRKGDVTQNPVLNEGDCLYLTSNNKITVAEIFNYVARTIQSWYYAKRADED